MVDIIPSILTDNPTEFRELLETAETAADRISIDVEDGEMTSTKTVDLVVLDGLSTSADLDFQLMVKEPVNWITKCVDLGADRVIGHIEMMSDQDEFVGKLNNLGVASGLALDIDTPIDELVPGLLNFVEVILLMSYPAGIGGQPFEDRVLEKVKALSKSRKADGHRYAIQVDGGINASTIAKVVAAGADEVSVGRSLFKGDMKQNIEKLQKIATKQNQ